MTYTNEPIAVIGTGCRFPGDSSSPSKLWKLLSEPRDVQSRIDRFKAENFYNKDGHRHGTSNVTDAYLLSEDPRTFDAQFFNISAGEAESIDPQHRLLLETVYESVENAGMSLESLKGSQTAVYVGVMCDDYTDIVYHDSENIPTYAATGSARSILSNRISYFFDWHGPSMTIDTACSSSLIAVHQAVQVLRSGESRCAVAGGANLIFGPKMYVAESNLSMLSPTGRSRMWDSSADGYARGEGVAAVIMKKLSDAIADGDNIDCIIRETGTNQDGRTMGITMPSSDAQAALIAKTYAKAGLDLNKTSDRPQYFEAHGTGTKAGDPQEARAIFNAFYSQEQNRTPDNILHVGSIKTIIGHTEGTAGLAGLIKASLAIQNKTIPANLLFNNLNPDIEPYYTQLRIPTKSVPWPELPEGVPRRVSVNSFGFGGANAHAIVESYEPTKAVTQKTQPLASAPFLFSATSEKTLERTLMAYLQFLKETPDVDLRDLSLTLTRRSALASRVAISAATHERLIEKIQACLDAKADGKSLGIRSGIKTYQMLGVFTGQGAQWATMGAELIESCPSVAATLKELEVSLAELPESDRPTWNLTEQILADAKTSRIAEGAFSQPLCTAVQVALINLLAECGISFYAVVGHSSGEIAACYAAGFITARDAIRIAYYRGLYAKYAKGPNGKAGSMLAAGTDLADAEELCALPTFEGRLKAAASNSSASVTLSGDEDAIDEAKFILEDESKFARKLKVDTAYHSHHMLPCSSYYLNALAACNIKIQTPSADAARWYSSVHNGQLVTMEQEQELRGEYWMANMLQQVQFSQALTALLKAEENEPTFALEVGPHPALKGPATLTIEEAIKHEIPYSGVLSRGNSDMEAFGDALGTIWSHFTSSVVDFIQYDSMYSNSKIFEVLKTPPNYVWDKDKVYWNESRSSRAFRQRKTAHHELLGSRLPDDSAGEMSWRNHIKPADSTWLRGHEIQGQKLYPAAGYAAMAIEACKSLAEDSPVQLVELVNLRIHQALAFIDEVAGVETLVKLSNVRKVRKEGQKILVAQYECFACLNKEQGAFTLMSSAKVELTLGEPTPVSLPERVESNIDMTDVNVEEFYNSLIDVGYNYTGVFKGVHSLRRAKDLASGTLISLPEEPMTQSYIFHPAPLDVAFQAVFAAIGSPGDGMLWTVHVPTVIKRISINPFGIPEENGLNCELPFDAYLEHTEGSGISGDVSIYDAAGSHTIVQIEGLHVTPLSAASASTDKRMFLHDTWGFAYPDAETVADEREFTLSENDKAAIIERTCLYYIRQLLENISEDDRDACDSHQTRVLEWAQHVVGLVEDDRHPTCKFEWLDDEEPPKRSEDHHDELDRELDIVVEIGEKLISFMRNEISVEELYGDRDIIHHLQQDAFGLQHYQESLARLVKQITHRHQNMTILQIGSGLNTTQAVLEQVGNNFSYYTYTDVTDEFFQEASDALKAHEKKFIYKVLDPELELGPQGLKPNSYDLIIAANVLHTSNNIEDTLKNVRSLLRSGGYLALLETTNTELVYTNFLLSGLPDYWAIEDNKRDFSPILNHREWDSLLTDHGFGGIDSTTPDSKFSLIPFSVMVSQAIDNQVTMMRNPLGMTPTPLIENLLLIGGAKLSSKRLCDNVLSLLAPFCQNTMRAESIQSLDPSSIPNEAAIVCLAELDQPLFNPFTAQKLKHLQSLVENAKHVLWVVQGAAGEQPFSNMINGVGRCLAGEAPHLRWENLDFDFSDKPDPKMIAEEILRMKVFAGWGTLSAKPLWCMEKELRCSNGRQIVSRVASYDGPNDRYNSSRREIRKDIPIDSSIVAIVRREDGFEVQEKLSHGPPRTLSEDHSYVNINVQRSSWNAFNLAHTGYFHLVLGTIAGTRTRVLTFSEVHESTVTVPSNLTIPFEVDEENEQDFFDLMICEVIAEITLRDLRKSHAVLVHEADKRLGLVLENRAADMGLSLTLTSSNIAREDCQYIHAQAPSRTLLSSLPRQLNAFVDFSESDESHSVGARLAQLLPQICLKVTQGALLRPDAYAKPGHDNEKIRTVLSTVSARALDNLVGWPSFDKNSVDLAEVPSNLVQANFSTTVCWNSSPTVSVRVVPAEDNLSLRSDKTYFMVGLCGSLGLSLCNFMVDRGAKYFALTSRKPNISEEWMNQMKRKGAVVNVYAMDVTNKASVKSVVKTIRHEMPPIVGVANGAMVLIDSLLSSHTFEKFNTTLEAKVNGTRFLDEIFTEKDLDFFMAFSSLAFTSGNYGQTSYAAANGFMTSLVEGRRKRGLAGCVMHLAGIYGVGYVERTDRKIMQHLEKYGMYNISEWDFHQFFAEAVACGRPESGLSADVASSLATFDPEKDEHVPAWAQSPRYGHFCYVRQETADEEDGDAAATNVRPALAEATTEEAIYDILLIGLKNTLAKQLHLPSVDEISPDQAVVELGVDSLSAVDLRAWFTKELDIDMPVLKILGGATLAEVVSDAVKRLPKELTPKFASASTSAPAEEKKVEEIKEEEEVDESVEVVQDTPAMLPTSESKVSLVSAESSDLTDDEEDAPVESAEDSGESSATSVTTDEAEAEKEEVAPTTEETSQMEVVTADDIMDATDFEEIIAPVEEEVAFEKIEQMSYGSTRFWFLDQFLSDPTTFNLMFVMRFKGKIDVDRAERTIAAIGERHEAFRTAFFADADNMNQPSIGVMSKSRFLLQKKWVESDQEIKDETQRMLETPLNLEKGDTSRVCLLESEDNDAMVMVFHHIIMDGFSFNVLLSDMNKLYAGEELPVVKKQFSDFAVEQRKAVESGALDSQLDYWKSEYPDFPDPLPLFPTAKVSARQPLHNYDYEEVKIKLDAKTMSKIRQQSRRLRSTTFHYFFAVMKIFMFRMLDVDDIAIGMADANRTEEAISNTMGFFLNLLPIRFKANEQESFGDAVAEVRQKVYSALANSKLPFDVLLEQLAAPRSASHSPIFQAFIDYRQFSGKPPPVLGKEVVSEAVVGRTAYDLVLDVNDISEGDLTIAMRAQKHLYSQESAQMLLDGYVRLLKLFASGRRVIPSKVPVYESRSIKNALTLGRGRYMESQWPATLSHRIDEMAARYPTSVALKDDLGNELTYAQMMDRVNMISNKLLTAGVDGDQAVGVFQEPSVDWICSVLGIWRAGSTYVPLDLRNGMPRLQAIVQDCKPVAIMCHDLTAQDVPQLEAQHAKTINVSALNPITGECEVENMAHPDGRAVVIYTSGSTGVPKGIVLKHSSIRNEMEGYTKTWGIGRETVLQQSAYSFDFSLDQICTAMSKGGCLFVASKAAREDPVRIAEIVATEGITYTKATPSEYSTWIQFASNHLENASSWKLAFGGGEAITKALMRDFKILNLADLRLLNSYGPAEATISCVKADVDYRVLADGEDEVAPAGFALPNYCLQIVDKNLEPVPVGIAGEILIGGAGISYGYLNSEEMTNEKFIEDSQLTARYAKQGWTTVYRTGDKGYLREDGALIIQGRISGDTQIKLRGIRMELADIENTILQSAGGAIVQCVVSVRGEPQFLVAHAKFSPEIAPENRMKFADELVAKLPLPNYMKPSIVIPLENFPLNTHNKTDRRAIAALPLPKVEEVSDEDLSETEVALRDIWKRVVSVEIAEVVRINKGTDFFQAGGNSLLLVKLQTLILEKFDVSLPIAKLFGTTTLSNMAELIEESDTVNLINWAAETAVQTDLISEPAAETKAPADANSQVVLLTGATGYLGSRILQSLIASDKVSKIHTVAVRYTDAIGAITSSDKVTIHSGDLTRPRLGLDEDTFATLSEEVDVIIHSGANRSFWDQYHLLRAANVSSTKELARLANSRKIPIHFLSSGGVIDFAEQIGQTDEVSVRDFLPPVNGSQGYLASKWASEIYLENAQRDLNIPIHIHRVTPATDGAVTKPTDELLQELGTLVLEMKTIPMEGSGWEGTFDLVAANPLADKISSLATSTKASSDYSHYPGELRLRLKDLETEMEEHQEITADFERVLPHIWIGRAKKLGFSYHVASNDVLIGGALTLRR